jgi:succinate dehydrogenase / fumarate reductase, cytochrome b subunit
MIKRYLGSSIGKKQIIAVSGLIMVSFLIAHLIGNLLIFKGADALNEYSQMLHNLGSLLWVARIGLIGAFVTHFLFIALLVIQNRKARGVDYAVPIHGSKRSLSTKTMRFSGLVIFVYIFWHLYDYTFTVASPQNAILNGEYQGLYGLLYNSFLNPVRSVFYIVSMFAIGLHLTHAIQSVFQTFGLNHPNYTPCIKRTSLALGLLIAFGFSSIPIYVMVCGG